MLGREPMVCICIPTYNAAATIKETISSLLSQTYTDFIIKVSDNASTDATLEIVDSFDDERISVHLHETNIGAEGNFTYCISLGVGEYTAIFHADDVYEPTMLAEQVRYLDGNPDVGAVFSEATLIDASGREFGSVGKPPGPDQAFRKYDFNELLLALGRYSNFLICPSAMVRTRIYQDYICHWRADEFASSADLDVWLRISRHHCIAVICSKLMRYRYSESQGTTKLIRNRTAEADFFKVMDYYLSSANLHFQPGINVFRYYGWLRRSDRMVRAVNLFLSGQFAQAQILCDDAFGIDALRSALHGIRGFHTWMIGLYLRFLLGFRLGIGGDSSFGYVSLRLIKRLTRR